MHHSTRVPKNAGIFMNSMQEMYRLKAVYISLCLVAVSLMSYAQPTRSRYKAFVFSVTDAQTNKPVEDISLCMYDQTGRPLVQWVETMPGSKNNKTILDSFYCWLNHRSPFRQSPGQQQFFQRQSFGVLNNEWVCILPAFSGNIDLLSQSIIMNDISEVNKAPWVPLFLQLKLHDPKGRYADALIPIPKDRCYFTDELNRENNIVPIQVVISKTDTPRLHNELYGTYWYPVFKIQRNQNVMFEGEANTATQLLAINAYHEKDTRCVKQILSPKADTLFGAWGKGPWHIVPSRLNLEYPDFFIPRLHSTVGLYYTYSKAQATYVIDTAVHAKNNLRYSAHLDKLFADDTVRRGANTCRLTYAWEKRHWQLVLDTCFLLPEKPLSQHTPPISEYSILYASRPGRVYPLRVFESDSLVLYDTFFVSNPTARNVKVNVTGMPDVLVNMPRTIKAQETVPVYIEYKLRSNGNVLHTFSGGLYIQFGANQTLSYYLTAPMLAKGTLRTKGINNEWHYYQSISQDKLFFVSTDSASTLTAYGHVQSSDSQRIGLWHMYEPNGQLHRDTVYSKSLRLVLANDVIDGAIALLYKSNRVCDTLTMNVPAGFQFSMRGPIDSIVVLRDSSYGFYMPRYQDVIDGMSQYIHWLKPQQDYYIHQGVRVPIDFKHHEYFIQWNSDVHARQFSSEKELNAFEYKKLKQQFVQVKVDTTKDGDYYLDLTDCSTDERNNIIDYVLNTRKAKAMCKLHRKVVHQQGLLYGTPRITVFVPNNRLADFKRKIPPFDYNFVSVGGPSGGHYIYEAKWPLVDETYYERFNKMVLFLSDYQINSGTQFRIKPVFDYEPKRKK